MELGTSTCLFYRRRGEKTSVPFAEQIKLCADAGFRVLDMNFCDSIFPDRGHELALDDWEAHIYDAKNQADKLGCKFTQSHSPFNQNIFVRGSQPTEEYMEMFNEMTRRSIIASSMLGVKWMVVHALNDTVHTEYDTEVVQKTNLEFFAWQVELAQKYGVGIAIENMFEINQAKIKRFYCASPDDLINLIDAFGSESVGACWDFGHAHQVILSQPKALRRLGKRLKATHVQDNKGERDTHMIPFVGGNIPWEKIMPCLKEIGYEGDFVYESHRFTNDLPDALRPEAARLAYSFGKYCMELYDKA